MMCPECGSNLVILVTLGDAEAEYECEECGNRYIEINGGLQHV